MNFSFESKLNLFAAMPHSRTAPLADLRRAHFHLTTSHQLRAGCPSTQPDAWQHHKDCFTSELDVWSNEFSEYVRTVYAWIGSIFRL